MTFNHLRAVNITGLRSARGIVDTIKDFAADMQLPLSRVTVEVERDGRDGTLMMFLGRRE